MRLEQSIPDSTWIRAWARWHTGAMLAAVIAVCWCWAAWPLAAIALVSFVAFVALGRPIWGRHRPLGGYANWVTALRLAGVLGLGFLGPALPPLVIGVSAAVLVTIDGLDGYLARKYDTASEFGLYFDMETDALQVCILSALTCFVGEIPAAILLIGFMRYLFVAATNLLRVGHKQEPRFFLARFAAVFIQYSLAAVFLLPPVVHLPAVALASALILYSFGRSTYYAVTL